MLHPRLYVLLIVLRLGYSEFLLRSFNGLRYGYAHQRGVSRRRCCVYNTWINTRFVYSPDLLLSLRSTPLTELCSETADFVHQLGLRRRHRRGCRMGRRRRQSATELRSSPTTVLHGILMYHVHRRWQKSTSIVTELLPGWRSRSAASTSANSPTKSTIYVRCCRSSRLMSCY